jgi:hypothetical protein
LPASSAATTRKVYAPSSRFVYEIEPKSQAVSGWPGLSEHVKWAAGSSDVNVKRGLGSPPSGLAAIWTDGASVSIVTGRAPERSSPAAVSAPADMRCPPSASAAVGVSE